MHFAVKKEVLIYILSQKWLTLEILSSIAKRKGFKLHQDPGARGGGGPLKEYRCALQIALHIYT